MSEQRTKDAIQHVGNELAETVRVYENLAYEAEGQGGLHAEYHAAYLRLIRDVYQGLGTFLLEKLDRMLEAEE